MLIINNLFFHLVKNERSNNKKCCSVRYISITSVLATAKAEACTSVHRYEAMCHHQRCRLEQGAQAERLRQCGPAAGEHPGPRSVLPARGQDHPPPRTVLGSHPLPTGIFARVSAPMRRFTPQRQSHQ